MQKGFSESYRSTQWQEKKNRILTRDNYTCAICGKHGGEHTLMHVHHLTYKNCKGGKAWNCPDEDLVTLCEDCHKLIHSGHPYKSAYENISFYKEYYSQSTHNIYSRDIIENELIKEEKEKHAFENEHTKRVEESKKKSFPKPNFHLKLPLLASTFDDWRKFIAH